MSIQLRSIKAIRRISGIRTGSEEGGHGRGCSCASQFRDRLALARKVVSRDRDDIPRRPGNFFPRRDMVADGANR